MQYFTLDNLGLYDTDKYCMSESDPENVEDPDSVFEYGGSLANVYPENPLDVNMYLDEDSPKHIKLGDYVSTSGRYLMVSEKVEEELKKHNVGEIELWPFSLINHKGKVHSTDYRFVIFKNQFDALNLDESKIKRSESGTVLRVRKIVLDKDKLKAAPDMFLLNDTRRIVFSEKLAEKLENDYTNFAFEELDVM